MPNWVSDNLTITGPASDVQAIKARLAAPYERTFVKYTKDGRTVEIQTVEQDFSFWNIVRPEGEDLAKYDDSLGAPGAMPFWYDWNCENWGTKWDTDAELTEHSSDHLQYVFSTAWSPPFPALAKLGEQFPGVHIELEWEEEQGYGGTVTFTNGVTTELDYYDIPTSHAEIEDRKGEGSCPCEAYGEKLFADCPIDEIDPACVIPNDEIIVESML